MFTGRRRLVVFFCVSQQGGRSPKQPRYRYRKVGGGERGRGRSKDCTLVLTQGDSAKVLYAGAWFGANGRVQVGAFFFGRYLVPFAATFFLTLRTVAISGFSVVSPCSVVTIAVLKRNYGF